MLIFPSFFNAAAGGYEIANSLRFRGNQWLSRTPASNGNRQTWSYSLWMKADAITNNQCLIGTVNAAAQERYNYRTNGLFYVWATGGSYRATSGALRDPAAWYHFLLVFDSTNANDADRMRFYINGERSSLQNSSAITQNASFDTNSTRLHYIGNWDNGSGLTPWYQLKSYLAEVHMVDGTAHDPTTFGEFNADGVWVPKEVTGITYGTNGFYLKFDPSATNGIGHDHSGNGNNWTPTGFDTTNSTASTYDVMSDTPTTNWCTWNPLKMGTSSVAMSNGSLVWETTSAADDRSVFGTIGMSSGKWYWEVEFTSGTSGLALGIALGSVSENTGAGSTGAWIYYASTGNKILNGTSSSYGATFTTGDIIGIAFDATAGDLTFYKNGTSQGTAATGLSADTYFPVAGDNASGQTHKVTANFGQRAFAYTQPTGFKALNTSNLPAPTVKDGSKNFDTALWTNTTDVSSLSFQPDLVWVKGRSYTSDQCLTDAVRGVDAILCSSDTGAESLRSASWRSSYGQISSFDPDGFTISTGSDAANSAFNRTNNTQVAWNWLAGNGTSSNTDGSITSTVSANPSAGFSIVSYTAENAVRTIGHGLGVAPKFIIVKDREATQNWAVYHESMGNTKAIYLDLNLKTDTNSGYWNNTSPTSTVFTVGTNTRTGGSTNDYIAYCFAEVEGYSKIGSYTGNGSSDGPFIYTGFRPAFILFKNYAGGSEQSWTILDNTRDTYNAVQKTIYPDIPNAEDGTVSNVDFCSNGFKLRNTWQNEGSSDHLYIAFAENPFGGSGVSPATAR